MFIGSMVAIVTPMKEDGSIDLESFKKLIDWHIESGTNAIVVAGTTGESATLTLDEHFSLINTAVKQANGQVPIIAGAGTNSTQHTLELCENAKKAGANGLLLVTPYYNKPTQKGLYEHYKTVADKIGMPIILYNVPGRTGCDLLPETVAELAKIPNIVAIKEATGDVERAKELLTLCGKEITILSGDDPTALDLINAGAKGVISVTANVAPKEMHELMDAALNGRQDEAREINEQLMPLHKDLFLQSNPIPTKWALYHMGKIPAGIRLPLLPLESQYQQTLQTTLEKTLQETGVA